MNLTKIVWILVGTFLLLLIGLALLLPAGAGFGFGECVGVIRLNGELFYESPGLFATGTTSNEVTELIKNAEENDAIKSILFIVNSPGGSAVASKEIYDAVRDSKNPVVAYFAETATSGAYYAVSSSDWIIANPNTITGSIGARATILNYEELFKKIGLREEEIKSGEMKDIASGARNLTLEERKLLSALINETFENFKNDVAAARGAKVDNPFFQQALDARILSAKMALRAGLVDEVGGFKRALRKAGELGGIAFEEEPPVCELKKEPGFFDLITRLGASFARGFASELHSQEKIVLEYR